MHRLQTDYIDLYQSHEDDATTPLEETLGAYAQLIKEGKVRAIGASNYSAERLAEALQVSREHGLPAISACSRNTISANAPATKTDLEPLFLKEGIGVIPYFALASGFLTGKYRSEADLGKSPRGAGGEEISGRARISHPGRARRSRRGASFDARKSRARLADGPARHHRAHRQRHQRRAVDRSGGRCEPELDAASIEALNQASEALVQTGAS